MKSIYHQSPPNDSLHRMYYTHHRGHAHTHPNITNSLRVSLAETIKNQMFLFEPNQGAQQGLT